MYKVSVRTGDMFGAGTDASVFLTIYGDLGDTGERKLAKSENNKNKFERGEVSKERSNTPGPSIYQTESLLLLKPQVDKFTIEAVDLGHVFKIYVRHDNSLIGADWYLDQVEVLDMETEEVYMFLCERWLSTKKEDKRVDRTFYVKVWFGLVTFEGDSFVSDDCFFCLSSRDMKVEETQIQIQRRLLRPNRGWTEMPTKRKRRRWQWLKRGLVSRKNIVQILDNTDFSVM